MLQTLGDAQLYINFQKCVIGVPEIPVLGWIVGKQGVRADPEKVKAINKWPVPRNVKDLRQFLGPANYLHKYSKNYAERTEPMSDFLKKDAEWNWCDAQVAAFNLVKQLLVEARSWLFQTRISPFVLSAM